MLASAARRWRDDLCHNQAAADSVCSCAGIILAYSNSVAGRLSDVSVSQGYGNIGCFLGGAVATVLSGLALLLFSKFSDLGREDKIVTLKKAKA